MDAGTKPTLRLGSNSWLITCLMDIDSLGSSNPSHRSCRHSICPLMLVISTGEYCVAEASYLCLAVRPRTIPVGQQSEDLLPGLPNTPRIRSIRIVNEDDSPESEHLKA